MIEHSINKLLFFDIETVGMTPDLNSLEEKLSRTLQIVYKLFGLVS